MIYEPYLEKQSFLHNYLCRWLLCKGTYYFDGIVVPIKPDDTNGLNTDSFIVCIDPMTFDKQRLVRQLGILDIEILGRVQSILHSYLDLDPANSDLDESLE